MNEEADSEEGEVAERPTILYGWQEDLFNELLLWPSSTLYREVQDCRDECRVALSLVNRHSRASALSEAQFLALSRFLANRVALIKSNG